MFGTILGLALQAAPPLAAGIVVTTTTPGACFAMPGPQLAAGDTVTLIRPAPTQLVATAVVERPVAACARLEQAQIDGPYYVLSKVSSPAEGIWIVFRPRDTSPQARVRGCTSSEGLHLTVWSGEPLKSRRVWHQYFYLGYDVEPTCEEGDTRP